MDGGRDGRLPHRLLPFQSKDIDVYGDTAVIHARYSQIANYDAVDLSHGYRLTDVWARIDGRWQVIARHSSILS